MMNRCLILTIAVALVSLLAAPLAAADADPSALHRLAKQAQVQAQIQAGPTDPPRVQELIDSGEDHVRAILNSTSSEEAGDNFLTAMQMFSDAFRLMNQNVQEAEDDIQHYTAVLERETRYYNQLLELAETYNVEVPRDEMDGLFGQAASQIEAGDEDAAETLESINDMLGVLRERIGSIAGMEDVERAIEYATLYVGHLKKMIDDAKDLNIPPDGVELMQDRLDRLIAATEPSEIISIINDIITIKQDLDTVKANQLEKRMQDTNYTVKQLLQQGILDDIEHAAVEATLERFLDEMDLGDLDEAEMLLDRLDAWLLDQQG